ncbi:transketolase C-terminal domain-containing protein [Dechloromonas sp. ZS-1]|uniref:alpha-ketoacid dehydrogenase subunit beta n=1 Tax=Dechloromonas sp. ZS-1 TaxID=3138067 RepID=UPI0031FC0B6E
MALTYLQSLQKGLKSLFESDPRVILLGEDVLDPYGGAFKVTTGLSTLYPDRVLTTPISEAAITGIGAGLALRGNVPIIEIMFGDFLTLCADQLVNHAAKFPLMYSNVLCPLIIRTPMGGGRGYGPTHSQSIEKMFFGLPGLKIIAPSHFHSPGRTLQKIVQAEQGPVIFIESKLLYGERLQEASPGFVFDVVKDETGYETTIVQNFSVGEVDVALIAYGGATRHLPNLLRELAIDEIRVVAIFPECIDPFPQDLLVQYTANPGRIVIVDEGHDGFNWATGVAACLYEKLWGRLQAPIRIVASEREIIPTSHTQENEMLVTKEKIEAAILEVISWE